MIATSNNNAVSDSDTKKVNAKAKNAPEKKPAFVYVGPALPGAGLKSNAVLVGTREEIAKYYKDIIKKYPAVEKLIVPVAQLSTAREKVGKSGNLLNKYCGEITEKIRRDGVVEATEGGNE